MSCWSHAQESPSPISGSASLGLRSVDLAGDITKFREDINLDDGARLLDLSFQYIPMSDDDSLVDRVELYANNLGGDPFESIHFGIRKFGSYNLKLDRRRSEYFYEDTILPASLASTAGSTGGDFHHFDFERIRDTASLDINISPATTVSVGLERQTRIGSSTTTLDIQRDEFELDRPLDESLNAFTIGVQHAWDRVTLIFEEDVRDFENSSEMFLPGAASGQNASDLAELQFFTFNQVYDYDSRGHSLRAIIDPSSRFNLQVAWRREDLDLDMNANETSSGTDFLGAPFSTDLSGPGQIDRVFDFNETKFGFAINEQIRLVGGFRNHSLDQNGILQFGNDQGQADWSIDTDGFELGIEVAVLPSFIVSAGFSTEERDTSYLQSLNATITSERNVTDRDGYFARFAFEPGTGTRINVSIEDNSIENAFTLASPTGSQRLKASVRHRWDNGLSASGSYRRTDVENDQSGWVADTEQADIRFAWQNERLQLSAGYTNIDLARNIDQLVTAGFRQDLFFISYTADATLADLSAQWSISDKLTLGGHIRDYESLGSVVLSRDDLRVFLDVAVDPAYTLRIGYRQIEYFEQSFDQYDADILELALQLNW